MLSHICMILKKLIIQAVINVIMIVLIEVT